MSVASFPPAGRRRHAPRLDRRTAGWIAAAGALCGALFTVSTALPFAVLAGAAFVGLCLQAPAWAMAAFVFAHIAVPIYFRLPPIGPLPSPPIATSMLLVLGGTQLLQGLVRPRRAAGTPSLFSHTVVRWFLVFAAVGLLSLVDGRTTSEGFNMWVKAFLFPFVTLSLVVATTRSPADVDRLFRAALAASVVIAAYAIYEFGVGHNWLLENYLIPGASEDWSTFYFTADKLGPDVAYRSFSVFSQPIEFATCVGMIYPYAVIRFGTSRTLSGHLFYAAVAAVCFIGLATTFSRTGIGAALVATGLAGLLVPELRRWLVMAGASACAGLLLGWPWIGPRIMDRLHDVDNVTLRQKLWETALTLFGEHPLMGVGFGNFPQYYLETMHDHRIGPVTEFGADSVEHIRVAENFYFQLAAETGLMGLAAFACFLVAFVVLVVRCARSADREAGLLGTAVGLGAIAYFINAATVTAYTHFSSTLLLLGFLLPVAIVLDRCGTKPSATAQRRELER